MSLKLAAQNSKMLIKGKIIDNTSKIPVGFAYVAIKDSSKLFATIIDEDGRFGLFNITKGFHYIQISKQGYMDTVLLVNVSSDKEPELSIKLINKVNPDMISRRSDDNDNGNIEEDFYIFYSAPDFLLKVIKSIMNNFYMN